MIYFHYKLINVLLHNYYTYLEIYAFQQKTNLLNTSHQRDINDSLNDHRYLLMPDQLSLMLSLSMYTLNSIGDKMPPRLTPLETS